MPRLVSQIPIVDWDNPDGWLKDDNTGLPIMHRDSVKQMQYGANGLFWTGFMTHWEKADQPNPQMMPPHLRPEMIPISNRRAFNYPQLPGVPTNVVSIPGSPQGTITVSWTPVLTVTNYVVQCYDTLTFFEFGEYDRVPNPPYSDPIYAPPFTVPNLVANYKYSVTVASVNANGQSAFTLPVSLISSS